MIRLASRELLSRRITTGLAALGLLTASSGFVILLGAAQTTAARLSGDINRSWTTPYDLLIRPAFGVTALEETAGLVRPNYDSGLGGGITLAQLESIRRVQHVLIAAPLAVVGAINWEIEGVSTGPLAPLGSLEVFRSVITSQTDAGLSSAPVETHYTVVASSGELHIDPQTLKGQLITGGRTINCAYPVSCWAPQQCFGTHCGPAEGPAQYGIEMLQPMVVAGVDPQAEAQLANLDHCLAGGRYFTAADSVGTSFGQDPPATTIPALVSNRSFVDETFSVNVARSTDLPIITGASVESLSGWQPVSQRSVTSDDLYRRYLARLGSEPDDWPVWTASDVEYGKAGAYRLVPSTHPADLSIYERSYKVSGFPLSLLVPPASREAWFRSVTSHGFDGDRGVRYWKPVGSYDPGCLPGFDRLAGGGLEAYSVPEVRLEDGRLLRPNRSPGGYITPPPLILTTLEGAAWFADPARFHERPGKAFISVVRVRVGGIEEPSNAAQARLVRVATDIHDATGLRVDIVKGASQRDVVIDLAAGASGRPALRATEGWWLKGVALRFTRAVNQQNLALLGLFLLAAGILVAQTTYISVRRRRREFGVLRALGWPSWRILQLVELEVALLGAIMGIVGLGFGLALLTLFRASIPGSAIILALPLSMGVALLAGIIPAIAAGRGTTVAVLRGQGRIRARRPAGSLIGFALRELLRAWRIETLLGAAAVALGASMLGLVMLVALAFQGQLDTTVLGVFLSGRVRQFHLAIALLTLGIGALTAGEVMALAYLERQPHFATLRALGWTRFQLGLLLLTQGSVVGVLGGILAGGAMLLAGLALHAPGPSLGLAVAGSLVSALLATSLAIAAPLLLAVARPPGEVLRGE